VPTRSVGARPGAPPPCCVLAWSVPTRSVGTWPGAPPAVSSILRVFG